MRAWGKTDIGKVRSENQDTYYIELSDGFAACVVCDGMGGAAAGAIASRIAASAFVEEVRAHAPGAERDGEFLKELCRSAVLAANREVCRAAEENPDYEGMGTTLVAAVGSGSDFVITNIGDSRAYLISEAEGVARLTRDHSLVEDMMMQGDLTREQARTHPSKNLITRAIGADDAAECDVYYRKMSPGEHILLCSDGLTNMVEEQEILYEVLRVEDKTLACERLINLANDHGGRDNVTAVLLEI